MVLLAIFNTLIGLNVWCYYMLHKEEGRDLLIRRFTRTATEEDKKRRLLVGFILTTIFWPIAIYSNEFRKKKV